ncbi:hypothetical protein BraRD5C2_30880 [Bradyrhizobium sp. RD5-C2]|nr:hypothetical protein BraRD5C2_30880 [Bradyrhizobium sp. RD5-C2]
MLRVPESGEGAITVTGGSSVGAGVWACTIVSGAAAPMAVSTAAAPRVVTEPDKNRVAVRNNAPAITPTLLSRFDFYPRRTLASRLRERFSFGKQDVSRRFGILFHLQSGKIPDADRRTRQPFARR